MLSKGNAKAISVHINIQCVLTDNGTEFTNALLNPSKLTEFEQYLKKEQTTHKRIRSASTMVRLSDCIAWTAKGFIRIERSIRLGMQTSNYNGIRDGITTFHYWSWDGNRPFSIGRRTLLKV